LITISTSLCVRRDKEGGLIANTSASGICISRGKSRATSACCFSSRSSQCVSRLKTIASDELAGAPKPIPIAAKKPSISSSAR
jgi:hypothetical protein